jgi:proton-dependent oligopeptide transporter, POT family
MSASSQNKLDVKQLGLIASIASLGYVFWIVGAMEMVERLAFYGVRSVATLYGKDPVSKGGLGITPAEMGTIFFWWMLFQSWVPIFTGGIADRYGYKQAIFLSTVLKIIGYLVMAAFPSKGGFFVGALWLALGTAIFKPGIQGTLVKCTNRQNSSMAWGIFYQTVNIGAFIGPLLAGYMRKMEWKYVFLACAAIICLNFLLLLTYREPGKAERLQREAERKASGIKQRPMIIDTLAELKKPHLALFLAIFSGFYFMFYSLFDVLPNYIDEWVNTSDIVRSAGNLVHNPASGGEATALQKAAGFIMVLDKTGTRIQAEGLMNVNAGMIMLTCFFFGYLSSRVRITTSIWFGTGLATLALFICGHATMGWMCFAGIICFSMGEMLSSPKFSEFVGNLAPEDKKGTYLGLCQLAPGIGASIEGKLGLWLYGIYASKEAFARQMLQEKGLDAAALKAIPQGEAFDRLVQMTGMSPDALTAELWQMHAPYKLWWIMGAIGVATTIALIWYGTWVYNYLARQEPESAGAAIGFDADGHIDVPSVHASKPKMELEVPQEMKADRTDAAEGTTPTQDQS